MIPYHVYKVLHLTSVFMILLSLGGLVLHAINHGQRDHAFRKQMLITHGIGMLFALIAGFGLLARLGFLHNQWPPLWASSKICIWVILGVLPSVLTRKARWARGLWTVIIVLAAAAAYLANYKPL